MLRYILCLVYVCLSLGRGLFMPYLCDLFFICNLIFIVINHIITCKQTYLFLVHVSECLLLFLDDNVDEENEQFLNSKSSALGCYFAFA